MSDETSSLTNPIREGAGAIREGAGVIGEGAGVIGLAIFVSFFVPLIGFLGIQFIQMGGNWWVAGMFLLGLGFLTLLVGWWVFLALAEILLWGISVTVLMAGMYIFILIAIREKYSL